MTIEKLVEEKDVIDEKIKILSEERDEIVKQIEEKNMGDEEEGTELIKENENNNYFIQIFMSIMSFIGIIAGVIYVIYSKKEGLG